MQQTYTGCSLSLSRTFYCCCLLLSSVRLLLFSFKRRLDHSLSCICFDSHLICDALPLSLSLPCAKILSHSKRCSLSLSLPCAKTLSAILKGILSSPVCLPACFFCAPGIFLCGGSKNSAKEKNISRASQEGPCSYGLYVHIIQGCIIFTYVFIKPL